MVEPPHKYLTLSLSFFSLFSRDLICRFARSVKDRSNEGVYWKHAGFHFQELLPEIVYMQTGIGTKYGIPLDSFILDENWFFWKREIKH